MSKILFYSSKLWWQIFVCFINQFKSANFEEMIILKNSINVVINENHIKERGLIITTYSMQFLRIYNKINTIYYTITQYMHTKMDWDDKKLWKIRCNSNSCIRNHEILQLWVQNHLIILWKWWEILSPSSVVSGL